MSRRDLGAARSAAERALFALNASDVGSALVALDEATALLRPPAPVAVPARIRFDGEPGAWNRSLLPEPEPVAAPAPVAPLPVSVEVIAPAPKPPAKKARR